jgi:hypothetical protein
MQFVAPLRPGHYNPTIRFQEVSAMEPTSVRIGQLTPVGRLLDDIRAAFAAKQVHDGVSLMEQALELNVGWEALTQAVGEGIAGPTATP